MATCGINKSYIIQKTLWNFFHFALFKTKFIILLYLLYLLYYIIYYLYFITFIVIYYNYLEFHLNLRSFELHSHKFTLYVKSAQYKLLIHIKDIFIYF